jgi:uncharacterized Zn finger protein
MTRLIGNTSEPVEDIDIDCPDCGASKTKRKTTFDRDELNSLSVWCDACGHGWMTSGDDL